MELPRGEGTLVRLDCNGGGVAQKHVKGMLVDNDLPLTIGFEAWGGREDEPPVVRQLQGID